LADQVRRFCEDLERDAACQDWQVRQAEYALRIYFVNFLQGDVPPAVEIQRRLG
jgi:hypothetical protein